MSPASADVMRSVRPYSMRGAGSMEALDASGAKRLKELEVENAKPKRIVADQMLDMSAMKELLQKYW